MLRIISVDHSQAAELNPLIEVYNEAELEYSGSRLDAAYAFPRIMNKGEPGDTSNIASLRDAIWHGKAPCLVWEQGDSYGYTDPAIRNADATTAQKIEAATQSLLAEASYIRQLTILASNFSLYPIFALVADNPPKDVLEASPATVIYADNVDGEFLSTSQIAIVPAYKLVSEQRRALAGVPGHYKQLCTFGQITEYMNRFGEVHDQDWREGRLFRFIMLTNAGEAR